MKSLLRFVALVAILLFASSAFAAKVVTIYSADGLHDGKPNWYAEVFKEFTQKTGIQVQYIEGGSGVVVNRVLAERQNPQADVLVTLPPFMQKAAAEGALQPYAPPAARQIPAGLKDPKGLWYAMVNNYLCMIYNKKVLPAPPKSYEALLATNFKQRVQYSTPGQAGDGTGVMLQAFHAFGGRDAGFTYLKKLQVNNVGPSASTGRLAALVNKGEIWVANGDVQMSLAQTRDYPDMAIFFPTAPDGKRYTFALPYDVAMVKNAPHPAEARELLDFLLGKWAQDRVSSLALGFPVRKDVHPTDAGFKALQDVMQGVTVWTPDWTDTLQHLSNDISRWQQVTGN
ncbi:MAG: 2-aminoethylphosphonate ABC transporter substrate-binding protein [Syntrophobacteraceae bacterium]